MGIYLILELKFSGTDMERNEEIGMTRLIFLQPVRLMVVTS